MISDYERQNAIKELQRKRQNAAPNYRSSIPVPSSDWIDDDAISSVTPPQPAAAAGPGPDAVKLPEHVIAFPDILTASVKRKLSPVARVYLIMRAIDANRPKINNREMRGRGWVDVAPVRELLTGAGEYRLMTWRNLRGILNKGHGIFWEHDRERGRVFLYSPARAAIALKVGRLALTAVNFPLSAVLSGIQVFRAHVLAAFHAGRVKSIEIKKNTVDENDKPVTEYQYRDFSAPISRSVISDVMGIHPKTQKAYDDKAKTLSRVNIFTDENYSPERLERLNVNRRWDAEAESPGPGGGSYYFKFVDYLGKHGAEGREYIARRLPNTYLSSLSTVPESRARRRHNRKIVLQRDAAGNDFERMPLMYCADYLQAEQAAKKEKRKAPKLHPVAARLDPKLNSPAKLTGAVIWMQHV